MSGYFFAPNSQHRIASASTHNTAISAARPTPTPNHERERRRARPGTPRTGTFSVSQPHALNPTCNHTRPTQFTSAVFVDYILLRRSAGHKTQGLLPTQFTSAVFVDYILLRKFLFTTTPKKFLHTSMRPTPHGTLCRRARLC